MLRCRVPWERFSDLARQPLRGRVAGHCKPQQLTTLVAENKTCEELLKRNRRNYEQINRRNPLHMIAKEGLPSLGRSRRGTMYTETVDCATAMPSLSRSP